MRSATRVSTDTVLQTVAAVSRDTASRPSPVLGVQTMAKTTSSRSRFVIDPATLAVLSPGAHGTPVPVEPSKAPSYQGFLQTLADKFTLLAEENPNRVSPDRKARVIAALSGCSQARWAAAIDSQQTRAQSRLEDALDTLATAAARGAVMTDITRRIATERRLVAKASDQALRTLAETLLASLAPESAASAPVQEIPIIAAPQPDVKMLAILEHARENGLPGNGHAKAAAAK